MCCALPTHPLSCEAVQQSRGVKGGEGCCGRREGEGLLLLHGRQSVSNLCQESAAISECVYVCVRACVCVCVFVCLSVVAFNHTQSS